MKLDLHELSPEAVAIVDAELKTFKVDDSEEKRIFNAAFALVRNPDTWCQGTEKRYLGRYAKYNFNPALAFAISDHFNTATTSLMTVEHEDRYAYCSIGAVQEMAFTRMVKDRPTAVAASRAVIEALSETVKGSSLKIWQYNDKYSHREVIAAWVETGKRMGWM